MSNSPQGEYRWGSTSFSATGASKSVKTGGRADMSIQILTVTGTPDSVAAKIQVSMDDTVWADASDLSATSAGEKVGPVEIVGFQYARFYVTISGGSTPVVTVDGAMV